jgi:hypothetical protein
MISEIVKSPTGQRVIRECQEALDLPVNSDEISRKLVLNRFADELDLYPHELEELLVRVAPKEPKVNPGPAVVVGVLAAGLTFGHHYHLDVQVPHGEPQPTNPFVYVSTATATVIPPWNFDSSLSELKGPQFRVVGDAEVTLCPRCGKVPSSKTPYGYGVCFQCDQKWPLKQ